MSGYTQRTHIIIKRMSGYTQRTHTIIKRMLYQRAIGIDCVGLLVFASYILKYVKIKKKRTIKIKLTNITLKCDRIIEFDGELITRMRCNHCWCTITTMSNHITWPWLKFWDDCCWWIHHSYRIIVCIRYIYWILQIIILLFITITITTI